MSGKKKDQGQKEMPKKDKSMAGKDATKTKDIDEEKAAEEKAAEEKAAEEKAAEEKAAESKNENEDKRPDETEIYVQVLKNINDFRNNKHYECTMFLKDGKFIPGKPIKIQLKELRNYGPRLMKEVKAPKKKKEDDSE